MSIKEVFVRFMELLENRFRKGTFTTEDSIRYTFFYCLTSYSSLDPADIILEYPHPVINNAEVDMYIPPKTGRAGLAFEFKFDRTIPSGKNAPRPQKAGKIFADLMRLSLFSSQEDVNRYFVYVTDMEMAQYLQNATNQLCDFFNLMPEQMLRVDKAYIDKHSETFVKSAGSNINSCEVTCRLSVKVAKEGWLRIYEVNPLATSM